MDLALKNYFSDVLGLDSVLINPDDVVETREVQKVEAEICVEWIRKASNERLVVVFEQVLPPEAEELLEKMLGAMKLPADVISLAVIESISSLDLDFSEHFAAKHLMLMLKSEENNPLSSFSQWHTLSEYQLIATYSPVALLKDSELKKPTWDCMKMVMRELR